MLRATHLSIIMHSNASLSFYQDIILAIMLQNQTMSTRYRHAGSTEKVISLLGKKNTGKKTPKEDSEGLLRLHPNTHFPFTPPPTKKMQLSLMHESI